MIVLSILALGLGRATEWLGSGMKEVWGKTGLVIFIVFFLLSAISLIQDGSCKISPSEIKSRIKHYQNIGEIVKHSKQLVILAEDDGLPLRYFAWVEGINLPNRGDVRWLKMSGRKFSDPVQFLQQISGKKQYDYLVITDFVDFDRQKGLPEFLDNNYVKIYQDPKVLIYKIP